MLSSPILVFLLGIVNAIGGLVNYGDEYLKNRTEILQVTVMAQSAANYSYDGEMPAVKAISKDIISDKSRDDTREDARSSSVQLIVVQPSTSSSKTQKVPGIPSTGKEYAILPFDVGSKEYDGAAEDSRSDEVIHPMHPADPEENQGQEEMDVSEIIPPEEDSIGGGDPDELNSESPGNGKGNALGFINKIAKLLDSVIKSKNENGDDNASDNGGTVVTNEGNNGNAYGTNKNTTDGTKGNDKCNSISYPSCITGQGKDNSKDNNGNAYGKEKENNGNGQEKEKENNGNAHGQEKDKNKDK